MVTLIPMPTQASMPPVYTIISDLIYESNVPIDNYSLCTSTKIEEGKCTDPIRVRGVDGSPAVYCSTMDNLAYTSRGIYLFIDPEYMGASMTSTEFSIYRAAYIPTDMLSDYPEYKTDISTGMGGAYTLKGNLI